MHEYARRKRKPTGPINSPMWAIAAWVALACGTAAAQTPAPAGQAPVARAANAAPLAKPHQKARPESAVDVPTLVLPDGGRYYGPLQDGLLSGRGRLVWSDTQFYEGDFLQGRMQGQGKLTSPYAVFEGSFRDGLPSGKARMKISDGAIYEGDFVDGLPHGQGAMAYEDGQSFKGTFTAGQFTGKGTMRQPSGIEMTGNFLKFVPDGVMVTTYPGGIQYTGEMVNNRPTGKGELLLADGVRMQGDFSDGIDKGVLIYPNGDRYEGELVRNVANGDGVLRLFNGDVYRGEFVLGKAHGKGVLTPAKASNKAIQTGQWRLGRYVGATAPDENSADSPQLAARNAQTALYVQNTLLATQMAALKPNDPNAVEMYALFIAGGGTQEVFRREVEYVAKQFGQRFGTKERSMVLANSRTAVERLPLATETSIERALSALAQRMDREHDLLFVFLTSHGSAQHDLQIGMSGMRLPQLSAKRLGELLKASGIRKQVVVVSACYAGGFIEPLKTPTTWVIAAARADRTSFGCADENDFTYFGRAFFQESLPQNTTLTGAFNQAKRLVDDWETKLTQGEALHTPTGTAADSEGDGKVIGGGLVANPAVSAQAGAAAKPLTKRDANASAGAMSAERRNAQRAKIDQKSEPQMAVTPAFQREIDAWFSEHKPAIHKAAM